LSCMRLSDRDKGRRGGTELRGELGSAGEGHVVAAPKIRPNGEKMTRQMDGFSHVVGSGSC